MSRKFVPLSRGGAIAIFAIVENFLLATPDFGHSDFLHLNLALKVFLGESLKRGEFPLWAKDVGGGVPLLAEGQIGAFNLANIVFFGLFDAVTAINLSYLLIFLTVVVGAFFYARAIGLSRLSAIFLGGVFSLSGFFVTHLAHFNLIQAASFLPWQFFFTEKYLQTNQKRFLLGFIFVGSQQIFAGFAQIALISVLGLVIYAFLRKKSWRSLFLFLAAILGSLLLALPQIVPTVELVANSYRQNLSVRDIAKYPFAPNRLLTFLAPYFFEDPRKGRLETPGGNWVVFWETNGYLGVVPLIALLLVLKTKNKEVRTSYAVISLVATVLLLGKFSPFFLVFQIPPLSFFRVPARFLLLLVWSLAVLSSLGLETVKRKGIVVILTVFSLLNLGFFAATYNAFFRDAKAFLALPETVQVLRAKDKTWWRIYPINKATRYYWNDVFFKKGWQNVADFLPLRNAVNLHLPLIWTVPSLDFYNSGLLTKRLELYSWAVENGISLGASFSHVNVSSSAAKLLAFGGVKYLLSPIPIMSSRDLLVVATVAGQPRFEIYQVRGVRPHAYTTRNYQVASNIGDLANKMLDSDNTSVVVEKDVPIISDLNDGFREARVMKDSDREVVVETEESASSLLILSDSFYPNWKSYVSNRQSEILAVNLNQRGVVVPAGKHVTRFFFAPVNF